MITRLVLVIWNTKINGKEQLCICILHMTTIWRFMWIFVALSTQVNQATLFTLIWKFHVPLDRLSLKHPLERIAFLYHREQWLVNKLWVVLNKGSQRNTKAFVLATSRRLRKGYYRKQKGKNISCVSEKNSKTSPCCELD